MDKQTFSSIQATTNTSKYAAAVFRKGLACSRRPLSTALCLSLTDLISVCWQSPYAFVTFLIISFSGIYNPNPQFLLDQLNITRWHKYDSEHERWIFRSLGFFRCFCKQVSFTSHHWQEFSRWGPAFLILTRLTTKPERGRRPMKVRLLLLLLKMNDV